MRRSVRVVLSRGQTERGFSLINRIWLRAFYSSGTNEILSLKVKTYRKIFSAKLHPFGFQPRVAARLACSLIGRIIHRDRRINVFFYRGPNVSILHLRSTSDPWEVGSQGSAYSVGSNKSQTSSRGKSSGNTRGSYTRGTSIPSLKRHDTTASATSSSSLKQHRQDSHGQASKTLE